MDVFIDNVVEKTHRTVTNPTLRCGRTTWNER